MKKHLLIIITVLVALLTVIYIFTQSTQNTWPPPNVVKEPEPAGQWVMANQLTILASGQDIPAIVESLGGKIIKSVPQTDSYQAEFPVSNLNELDVIADQIRQKAKGAQVMRTIVQDLSSPDGPQ